LARFSVGSGFFEDPVIIKTGVLTEHEKENQAKDMHRPD
jgi:hypothetical protein